MSYGAQLKFGIARQAATGTAVSAPTSYHGIALTNEDVGFEQAELISQNLIGRFDQGAVYSGVNKVSGTIDFEVTPRNLHAALAAAVNWSPVSVTSGSLRSLTFVPNTQDYDSTMVKAPFTVYKQFSDANSAEQFYDVQFGQLQLSIAQGQLLKGKLTANGGTRSVNGVGSANILPDASDVSVLYPWSVASISIGGTAIGQHSDITVALNEQVDPLYTINASAAPFKYTRKGFREVTVNGTFYLTDRNRLNDFVAGTQRQLLITLQNTRTAIQSGFYNQLVIDVPQLKIITFKPGASGPGEVSVSFSGRGVLDATSGYTIQYSTVTTWQAGF